MTDHDADVAAVLPENIAVWLRVHADENWTAEQEPVRSLERGLLLELADERYAVVRLPEGVAVPHGARLVERQWSGMCSCHLYAIEPPEKESQNSDWWDDREANRAPLDAIEPPEATP